MNEVSPEKLEGARDYYEWFLAYLEVGFTEEQAMAILTRLAVSMTTQSQYPPEVMEFWERQNALATKMMVEMDE